MLSADYIDLILQDTPILIKNSFEKLSDSFPKSADNGKRDLKKRYDTAIIFVEYLFEMDKKQPPQIIAKYGKVSEYILSGLTSDLERIKAFIK